MTDATHIDVLSVVVGLFSLFATVMFFMFRNDHARIAKIETLQENHHDDLESQIKEAQQNLETLIRMVDNRVRDCIVRPEHDRLADRIEKNAERIAIVETSTKTLAISLDRLAASLERLRNHRRPTEC